MKKSFTLGAVSGITALAIGFPLAAQFVGAQSAQQASVSSKRMQRWDKREPLSQDDVEAMVDNDNQILLHIDDFVSIFKEAVQNHRIALQAAADMQDETERNDAVMNAHKAMRDAIKDAIEANPDLQMLHMIPFGPGGKGPHGPGMMGHRRGPEILAEKLGMTPDELKDALESGKTVDDIAEEKGVELPERPSFEDRP